MGIIVISTKDDDKEFRTGGWWVVKEDVIPKMFKDQKDIDEVLKKRVLMIADTACKILGLEKYES